MKDAPAGSSGKISEGSEKVAEEVTGTVGMDFVWGRAVRKSETKLNSKEEASVREADLVVFWLEASTGFLGKGPRRRA
jgi:hypothetical protein